MLVSLLINGRKENITSRWTCVQIWEPGRLEKKILIKKEVEGTDLGLILMKIQGFNKDDKNMKKYIYIFFKGSLLKGFRSVSLTLKRIKLQWMILFFLFTIIKKKKKWYYEIIWLLELFQERGKRKPIKADWEWDSC